MNWIFVIVLSVFLFVVWSVLREQVKTGKAESNAPRWFWMLK